MGLQAKSIVLTDNASQALEKLEASPKPPSISIARRTHALKPILLADCLYGEVVKKEMIPLDLSKKYGIENLFVVDLPSFWRLLYTIVRDRGERYIVAIDIVDHRKYDKWFPNRGR
jgi:hypothetical protein